MSYVTNKTFFPSIYYRVLLIHPHQTLWSWKESALVSYPLFRPFSSARAEAASDPKLVYIFYYYLFLFFLLLLSVFCLVQVHRSHEGRRFYDAKKWAVVDVRFYHTTSVDIHFFFFFLSRRCRPFISYIISIGSAGRIQTASNTFSRR